jgi:hypothetical protein
MSHTLRVVLPDAVVEPPVAVVEDLDEEHAEAARATEAVAQAMAASFLLFKTILRRKVSGRHRSDLGRPS